MLGIGLGIIRMVSNVAVSNLRWILNADASPVAGKSYVWFDGSTWADARKWKD